MGDLGNLRTDNGQTALLFILLVLATAFCIFYIRKKVIRFISENYSGVLELKVKWVLTGPPARGKGNFKYFAEFIDMDGNRKTLYFASSVFGNVNVIQE